MRPIYVSFRPQNRAVWQRIKQRAHKRYGRHSVLTSTSMPKADRDPIELHVEMILSACRKLVIIIGRDWAGLDEFGRFRLSTADVPIYAELRGMLRLEIPTVIVLVDGATLPPLEQVPEEFHALYSLPVIRLDEQSFERDLDALIPPPTLSQQLRYFLKPS